MASNALTSVTVLSPCDAYAAGQRATQPEVQPPLQPLIEHWDGTSWSVQQTPVLPADHLHIASIRASSPHDIWAAGGFTDGQGVVRTLILHSDGTTWRQVASPSPGTASSDLARVRPVSASNAWAVGTVRSGSVNRTLILHWDGKRWRQVPSPNPGKAGTSNELFGVTATSASSAWAVGDTSPGSGQFTALILQLKKGKWVQVASPREAGRSFLNAVGASSATNVWAVGASLSGGAKHTFAVRWNGRAWQHIATPVLRGEEITSVSVTSAAQAWATAGDNGLLRWDVHAWKSVATPRLPGSFLNAVAARPGGPAWAVGLVTSGTPPSKALALRCC